MDGKDKIKILFISHYSGMYGANLALLELLEELRNNYNIEPLVLVRNTGEFCEQLQKRNINYHILHFYWWVYPKGKSNTRIHEIIKQLRNHFKLKRIAEIMDKENLDLIYTNSICVNLGAKLSVKLGLPHIWHIRESLESYRLKFSLGIMFARNFLNKNPSQYIVISKFIRKAYQNLLPENRISLIYDGVHNPPNQVADHKNQETFNICIVGLVCEYKNQLDAIRALSILHNKQNMSNIHLHIIGSQESNYSKFLKEFINRNSLEKYISFYDHISNITPILLKMDLGLMCSENEAFGRVTIEYMLHKLPVIASNSGANAELVQNDYNGLIYNLFDSKDLANKLLYFIHKPQEKKQLGLNAFRYASVYFNEKRNAEEVHMSIVESLKEK